MEAQRGSLCGPQDAMELRVTCSHRVECLSSLVKTTCDQIALGVRVLTSCFGPGTRPCGKVMRSCPRLFCGSSLESLSCFDAVARCRVTHCPAQA